MNGDVYCLLKINKPHDLLTVMFFQMHVLLCSLWGEDIFEGSAELLKGQRNSVKTI